MRGHAEAIYEPRALIRLNPERIVSWGISAQRNARTVTAARVSATKQNIGG